MPAPRFTDKTLKFLRALKRHNDREWFRAHRDHYEAHVRTPMIEILDRLAIDLPTFAPDLVATPKVSMYRIHRDTRFSVDKSPYKTHVAAIMPHRELTKHGGAGLYFHVTTDQVLIGAGVYAPEPRQLYQLRKHIAANVQRFRSIVESPVFRRSFGALGGARLQRVPRGFDKDHPAAEYLKPAAPGWVRTARDVRNRTPLLQLTTRPLRTPCAVRRVPQRPSRPRTALPTLNLRQAHAGRPLRRFSCGRFP